RTAIPTSEFHLVGRCENRKSARCSVWRDRSSNAALLSGRMAPRDVQPGWNVVPLLSRWNDHQRRYFGRLLPPQPGSGTPRRGRQVRERIHRSGRGRQVSFISILKTVLGIEHTIAPFLSVIPGVGSIVVGVDAIVQRVQAAIGTVEASNPGDGQGSLKAPAVIADFNAGLDLTQQVL